MPALLQIVILVSSIQWTVGLFHIRHGMVLLVHCTGVWSAVEWPIRGRPGQSPSPDKTS